MWYKYDKDVWRMWYKVWKKCLLLFDSNSLKEECDIKPEKKVYYCLVVALWKCLYGLNKPWKGW